MNSYYGFFVTYFAFISIVSSSRVLELSDKFIDIYPEGQWMVKFYAPWCAHCRRMDPIWAHVAQSLYNTPIKVAKVDCTRFMAVANHFKVRAYPTIMFIKGSQHYEYYGEREKDDMVTFALRMSQPSIQSIDHPDSFTFLKEEHGVFFGYVGKTEGYLWKLFLDHAEKNQPHAWFYNLSHQVLPEEIKPPNDTAIFVSKEDDVIFFDVQETSYKEPDQLNTSLSKWINAERFGLYPKVTRSNIHHLLDSGKYLVIAVVSENRLKEISQMERDFKDMVESIIRKKKSELQTRFQFGWMGSPDLANTIAMYELSIPHLLVINSTTNHHHLPDDDPVLMTPEAILMFLDQVHTQVAPKYGGNSYLVSAYRSLYEARSTLSGMWRGNPVLTTLVFGLPMGFLSLICYSVCCADILDAADEDDDEETHEKKD